MQITTEIACPYCGHKSVFMARHESGRELDKCLACDNGCGGMFIVDHSVNVKATIKRIEGEEQRIAERRK